jgi:hypothetical protein
LRTRPRAGRTFPRARQTAAFWRSVDALAPTQKLGGSWKYSLGASKYFPASPTLGAGAGSACCKHRAVPGQEQSPSRGRQKFDICREDPVGKSLWRNSLFEVLDCGFAPPDRRERQSPQGSWWTGEDARPSIVKMILPQDATARQCRPSNR